ncbi:MAG: carbohydrate-binding domain-containing protein [Firmicutes bacterium]|nr:carbohydrate-binding domain-containing protein [Bacillota bacterium]
MKNAKIAVVTAATMVMSCFLSSGCAYSANDTVTVLIDGETISFDVDAQIIDGSTMVPLRAIFEKLGAVVKWEGDTQTALARKGSKTVSVTVGSDTMEIDKGKTDDDGNTIVETVELNTESQNIDGRVLVPIRAVSEAFNYDVEWDGDTKTVTITSQANDDTWKENTGTIDLDAMTCDGEGVTIEDNTVTITQGGDFTVTGTLEDGSILVSTEDRVKLRLTDTSITCSDGPAIYFESADKAFITLSGDSTVTSEDAESGAIYSKDNLEIKGSGTLTIVSAGKGIKASDNLTIEEGTINITSTDDGINVNDTFNMTGGTVTITSGCDGIASDSIVKIDGGTIDITTDGAPETTESAATGGAAADGTVPDATASPENGAGGFGGRGEMSGTETEFGASADADASADSGMNKRRAGMSGAFGGGMGGGFGEEGSSVEFTESSKGIKADWMLIVNGGEITINSTDHAIHCADDIEINGGTFNISSEYAKGISGHGPVTIDGEDTVITIEKSTEGIESKELLTINDGYLDITASDDGLNGATSTSGFGMDLQKTDGDTADGDTDGTAMPEMQDGEMPEPGGGMQGGGRGNMGGEPADASILELPDGGTMPEDMQNGDMTPPDMGASPDGTAPDSSTDSDAFGGRGGDMGGNGGGGRGGDMGGNAGGGMSSGRDMDDLVVINGGTINIVSEDDCIDSNGDLIINGGTITAVYAGATSGQIAGNFAVLDAEGQITIAEGVTLIAASGSASYSSISNSQNTIVISGSQYSAGDTVTVKSSSGSTIATYTPSAAYGALYITSPELETGKTYTITVGSKTYTAEITDTVTNAS